MKHANPNHSVRRSHAACRSSRDNERPPPASAARCSPAYSSPVLRMVALLSSSAASVRRPFSSSSPISARDRRSESVLCAASASGRRPTRAASLATRESRVGGDAVAVRVAHRAVVLGAVRRARPRLPQKLRARLAVASRGRRDRAHGELADIGTASRAATRSASAPSTAALSPGRTCSSAMASSSRSSRSSRARLPARVRAAASALGAGSLAVPAVPDPPAARSASARMARSSVLSARTCSAASGGNAIAPRFGFAATRCRRGRHRRHHPSPVGGCAALRPERAARRARCAVLPRFCCFLGRPVSAEASAPERNVFAPRSFRRPDKIDRAAFTHAMENTSDSAAARALQAAASSGASGAGACFSRPFLAVARRDRPVAPTKEGFFSDVIADSMRFGRRDHHSDDLPSPRNQVPRPSPRAARWSSARMRRTISPTASRARSSPSWRCSPSRCTSRSTRSGNFARSP